MKKDKPLLEGSLKPSRRAHLNVILYDKLPLMVLNLFKKYYQYLTQIMETFPKYSISEAQYSEKNGFNRQTRTTVLLNMPKGGFKHDNGEKHRKGAAHTV